MGKNGVVRTKPIHRTSTRSSSRISILLMLLSMLFSLAIASGKTFLDTMDLAHLNVVKKYCTEVADESSNIMNIFSPKITDNFLRMGKHMRGTDNMMLYKAERMRQFLFTIVGERRQNRRENRRRNQPG